MTEKLQAQAEAIPQTGEAEWFPPAEDDAEAALNAHGQRQGFFFGQGGLKWGWAIVLFLLTAGALIVAFLMSLVRLRMLHLAGDGHGMRPSTSAIAEAAQVAGVLLATALLAWVERRRMGRYGLGSPAGRMGQAAAGGAWGLLLLSLLVGGLWKAGFLVFSAPLLHGADALRWGAVWLVPFVLVALFEETGFRGALQFTLTRGLASVVGGDRSAAHRKALGFWTGAVLLAMLFGGLHLQNKGEAATGALSAGLIGLVFSFSLWRTGSLWWAVGFHALWDWAESFLYGVSDSGTVAVHRLFNVVPAGHALLSGGTVGPEGSLLVLPVIGIAALIVAWTLPSEAGSPSDTASLPNA